MSSEIRTIYEETDAIQGKNLGKCYKIYDNPKARLKQAIWKGKKQYYREFWALRNVSFAVGRGESLGIIGRNGSGKSTLLQMICGTLTPTEGSIKTSGRIAALLELGSGFNPEFTGIENVYLNASLLGLSRQQTECRLDDIKSFADIGDFINQPVKTYSSGMLVRLAFAVIAHVDPAVLIVDEALSVGDAVFGQRCMRYIRRFKEKGTLLFVSHDLNSVSSLCERTLWIDSGTLKLDSTNTRVIKAYTRYCLEASQSEAKGPIHSHIQSIREDVSAETSHKPSKKQRMQPPSKEAHLVQNHDNDIKSNKESPPSDIAYWGETGDFGNKHAMITKVSLTNNCGIDTCAPACGEHVCLSITAHCSQKITNFMSGFIMRDKTGLIVIGENSISEGTLQSRTGDIIKTSYAFKMPFLRAGAYSISVAISASDIDAPTVMHYKPDALVIEPIIGIRPVHGIFGLPEIIISSEINP